MTEEVSREDGKTQEWILQMAITLFLGFGLWLLIHSWLGMPPAEAFLVAGVLAAIAVYWIPPRPREGYLRWSLENLFFIVGFYLAFWKIPALLHLWIPYAVGLGLSLFVFFSMVYGVLKLLGYERRVNLANWLMRSLLWALYLSMLGSLGMER
jgi:hypothetical protein